ncbi:MAG: hypothetical protein ACRELC_01940 [Gemmatimonadota bacterium]
MADALRKNGAPAEAPRVTPEAPRDAEAPRPRTDLPEWLARELFKIFV